MVTKTETRHTNTVSIVVSKTGNAWPIIKK